MTRTEFMTLLGEASPKGIAFARQYVENILPDACRYHFQLNQSEDWNATAEERADTECSTNTLRRHVHMKPQALLSLLFSLLIWLPSTVLGAEEKLVRRLTSRYEGKIYEFTVMQSDLDAAPVWPEAEQSPPLSPRGALDAAREYVARTVQDPSRWTVRKICLESSGQKPSRWLYVVEFTSFPNRDEVLLGPGHSFAIPVLMNRRILEPKITSAKYPKSNE